VGGDAAGATLVRSTPPVVYAVVVPALFAYAKDGAPASVVASAAESVFQIIAHAIEGAVAGAIYKAEVVPKIEAVRSR
jgi:hypothetical protein